MLYILIILLRVIDNDATYLKVRNYQVYWNVPTFMCQKYGIYMNDLNKFGIYQNENDKFRGEKIVILYDPGMFPALIKNHNGTITRRNGGVPQEGNLQSHLDLFTTHLEEQVDENFSGLGVIDFESWRPIFRQNWASLAPYRDLSIKLENDRHPFWNKSSIKQRAVKSFESAGQLFMAETIKLAKKLRPHAHWSYYAYPYCFNLTLNQPSASCDPQVLKENDKLSWLWKLEDALLPSIYLRNSLSSTERLELITKRLAEATRLNKKFPKRLLLPYFSFKFHDQKSIYLKKAVNCTFNNLKNRQIKYILLNPNCCPKYTKSLESLQKDLRSIFNTMMKNGADGHIIWGSSQNFDSRKKCLKFKKYLNNTLGPSVEEIKLAYHLGHVKKRHL